MVVKNGCDEKVMVSADFHMESVDPRRIVLPYIGELWGDIFYETFNAALDAENQELNNIEYQYDDLVKNVTMELFFNIQRRAIHTVAFLHIDTVSNNHTDYKIIVQADTNEVLSVLADFFAAECPGLDESFRVYYQNIYRGWTEQEKFLKLIS